MHNKKILFGKLFYQNQFSVFLPALFLSLASKFSDPHDMIQNTFRLNRIHRWFDETCKINLWSQYIESFENAKKSIFRKIIWKYPKQ